MAALESEGWSGEGVARVFKFCLKQERYLALGVGMLWTPAASTLQTAAPGAAMKVGLQPGTDGRGTPGSEGREHRT